jgi:hypothetical protein
MLRTLAISLLLPAMLLNGLLMVCNPPGGSDSSARPEESADCIRICAALEATFGRICFFLPGNAKASITILDFGVAILPSEIALPAVATDEELAAELPDAYWNPSLSHPTPPPRA